jgi:hypothetical protein
VPNLGKHFKLGCPEKVWIGHSELAIFVKTKPHLDLYNTTVLYTYVYNITHFNPASRAKTVLPDSVLTRLLRKRNRVSRPLSMEQAGLADSGELYIPCFIFTVP